jgi:ATP-binding cassette subfamily B protein
MKKKTGISRLLEIAGEKRGLLIWAGIGSSVSALCMLIPYLSIYFILKELLQNAPFPSLIHRAEVIRWGIIALAGLAGGLAAMYAGGMCSHIAAYRILYGLRLRLASHIGRLSLGYLNGTSIGAVKKNLEMNVEKIESFIAHQLPDMVNVAVTVVVMLLAMFYLNPWLALACLLPLLLSFFAQASMMMGDKAQESLKGYFDALERINASAVQYVRGMPAVKVFGQTVHSFRKFYRDMIYYRDYCVQYGERFQNGFILFKVFLGSLVTFILPVGVYLLSRNPQNIAFAVTLLFFLIMAPGVAAPVYKANYLAATLKEIEEGVARLDAILNERPVPEPANPQLPSSHTVEFRQVSFSYQADGKPALADISFVAPQGKITALVGPSGSGKTTIAQLIPRFWDVAEGEIAIGGVDIRSIPTEALMNTISFVFQDSFLFYDTLYENIRIGKPDATGEEVYAAARAAQCHQFIEKLPDGYGTWIGEKGIYLSGGEEQRISVARAILKNAPILVLDEATAFADPENEYLMQLALKELMRNKTVIVIAHRLSSIRSADQILVLQKGRIIQRGAHNALAAADGLYKKLWQTYTVASSWNMGQGGVVS